MERTRIQLADGVYLTYLPARKFKTSLLSAQFVTPLQQETASAYALLPAILRRGTVRYPDLGALSARLDRLYGASVDYTVRKQGENQCVGFVASFIDDRFVSRNEPLLEPHPRWGTAAGAGGGAVGRAAVRSRDRAGPLCDRLF